MVIFIAKHAKDKIFFYSHHNFEDKVVNWIKVACETYTTAQLLDTLFP